MADGTRTQSIIQEMDERFTQMNANWQAQFADLANSLKEMMQQQSHGSSSGNGNNSRNSNNGASYSCNTRLTKLDFPRFTGNGVKQWIIQCETFFSVDQTPDDHKVRIATMHLEGKALQWHSVLAKKIGIANLPRWDEYAKILVDRFGDVCDDPMADLMRLRQLGSVTDYHEEFDSLVSRLELSAEYQLSCFLGGLKHEVQMLVRMFQPDSVRKAFSLAKMYESASLAPLQVKNAVMKAPRNVNPPLLPLPATANNALRQNANSSRNVIGKPLSPAFMSERRAKGLCFFCDEPFTPEHSMSHKKLQVHVMEVDDLNISAGVEESVEELVTNGQQNPVISMNALTGVSNSEP